MIYAFVQDCSVIETLELQREKILAYAESHEFAIDEWIRASSLKPEKFKENDILLLEGMVRLGKDVRSISETLQKLLSKGIIVYSCKDDLKFGGDYVSLTVLANALGLVVKIAEEVRSELTKEALTSRKRAGQKLGRPLGRKNARQKLDAKKKRIQKLFQSGKTEPEICRLLNIPRSSLFVYVKEHPELKPEAANA